MGAGSGPMSEQTLSLLLAASAVGRKEGMHMAKPSKSQLSKAGSTLASNSSSASAKSQAGKTLGKG